MSDELMELPEGWELTTLGETFNVYVGATPSRKVPEYWGGSIPWVSSGEVAFCQIHTTRETITEKGLQNTSTEVHPPGTILLGMIGEGKTRGQAAILKVNAAHNQNSAAIRVSEAGLIPKYLYYFLEQEYERTRQVSSGNNQPALNKSRVQAMAFPLAPLNEQRRIVEAIESLRDRSQKARSALAAIPELCDKFRQSVLAAAFRGDLTADWREQNPDAEPASVLLERIRKKRLVEAKTDKQKKSLEEIYSHEEEHGSEPIPDDWKYTALEKLCYSFQYGTSAKSLPEGKIPVLRMGNLQDGEIDWQGLAYTNDDDEISKYILKPGDILFNRTNSPELVGKTSIYRGEQPAIFAGYLIKIDNPPELDSEYLNYCLNTRYAKDYCWKVKTDGVSQSNINAQKLAKFEVPLCSLQEQQEIVRQIRSLFKAVSQIEQQYQWMKSYLNQLDRSILAKAFRGELVEQDPNDEPAAVLLERIRADREQQAQTTSNRRKRGSGK